MIWDIWGRKGKSPDHRNDPGPDDAGCRDAGEPDEYRDLPAEWLSRLYDDRVQLLENDDATGPIPCIVVNRQIYERIAGAIRGRPASVYTTLNIFDDGARRVFVEVVLAVSSAEDAVGGGQAAGALPRDAPPADGAVQEKFILNGRRHMPFFEALLQSMMLAFDSEDSGEYGDGNIVVVQLPNPRKVEQALDIIRKKMAG